jgi:hypothetical protein
MIALIQRLSPPGPGCRIGSYGCFTFAVPEHGKAPTMDGRLWVVTKVRGVPKFAARELQKDRLADTSATIVLRSAHVHEYTFASTMPLLST